jgi:hypothetical protein
MFRNILLTYAFLSCFAKDTFDSDGLRVRTQASFREVLNDKTNLAATTMSSDDYTIRLSTNRSQNSHDPQGFQNNGKHTISSMNNTSIIRGSAPLSMSMTIPSKQTTQSSNMMPTNDSSSNGLGGGYIDVQARNEKRGPITPKPFLKKGSRKVSRSLSVVHTSSVYTDPLQTL